MKECSIYIKKKGKLQSTPLKFGVAWILYPDVWKNGFYTLKFSSINKTSPSVYFSCLVTRWSDNVYFFCQINLPKRLCPNLKHKTIYNMTHYQKSKTHSRITSMVDPCGIKKKTHFFLSWSPNKFKTTSLLIWLHSIGHPMIIQLNGSKDSKTLFKIRV